MIKTHKLMVVVATALFAVPFFWLPWGTVDIGGDGGRLYLYDPVHLIQHVGFYYLWPQGTGLVTAPFSRIPFFGLLSVASTVIGDMHLLESLYNALKLVLSFVSVYVIILLLLQPIYTERNALGKTAAAVIGGLFYIFNPAMTENYIRALPTHDQVFLNPLLFCLFLLYLHTNRVRYLYYVIFVSVLFSHNFQTSAAPPFFAFYPLSVVFLFFYTVVRKIPIPWVNIVLAGVLFIGFHAYHLYPELHDIFDAYNSTTSRIFNKADAVEQVTYFVSVLPIPKVSLRWFAASLWMPGIAWSFIFPLIIIIGFLFNNGRLRRTMVLLGFVTLLTLFLATGKVSDAAVGLYKQFFLMIPGFSMFRNFYGQFQFVFFFFYSLLFGVATSVLFLRLGKPSIGIISVVIGGFLLIRSVPFLNGSMVNQVNHLSDNVRVAVAMDPEYGNMLSYIRKLPADGKILLLPFTDCCYQVIHGTNNGAYVGKSSVGYLTGKHDFSGYAEIAPYSDTFWRLSKEKNYEAIKKLLGMLNIRYILYNSDTKAYDSTFPSYPYEYAKKYLPETQAGYRWYVDSLASKKLFTAGMFELYEVGDDSYLPLFYAASRVRSYTVDANSSEYGQSEAFFDANDTDYRGVFLEKHNCASEDWRDLCFDTVASGRLGSPYISFERENPTTYRVTVSGSTEPYMLVMLMGYNEGWTVSLRDESSFGKPTMIQLAKRSHVMVNGYANAWYITPEETGNRESYVLTVELKQQKLFYAGLIISLTTGIFCLMIGGIDVLRRRRINEKNNS